MPADAVTAAERAAFWLSLSDREWAAAIAARPVPMRLANKALRVKEPPGRGHLTRREREVLEVMADSVSAREVGEVLGISRFTVEDHLKSVRRVLGARSTREAVAIGLSRGLIAFRDPDREVSGGR